MSEETPQAEPKEAGSLRYYAIIFLMFPAFVTTLSAVCFLLPNSFQNYSVVRGWASAAGLASFLLAFLYWPVVLTCIVIWLSLMSAKCSPRYFSRSAIFVLPPIPYILYLWNAWSHGW
jgi:hypothetical protein